MRALLTPGDHARLADAIKAAEARTDAEIVCVVAGQASDWRFVPVLYAATLALVAPWGLLAATRWDTATLLLVQLNLFAIATLVLSWPPLRFRLAPRAAARRRAHQAASEQFLVRGIGRTEARAGVLIFIAVAERYACVIPDSAAQAAVPQETWRKAIEALTDDLHAGRPADGLEKAIGICADALAAHRPAGARNRNELADRVIEY